MDHPTRARGADTFQLFAISFVGLYLEILLIRWLGANVRLLGYFTNIVLIASFFGLSIGCLVAPRRRAILGWWPAPWTLLLLAAWGFGVANVVADMKGQVLFHTVGADQGWPVSAVIVLFYVLVVATFVPLGERLGQELGTMAPVRAYSVNVAGSIAGVLAFAAFSFLRAPSIVWFGVLLALMLLLRPPARAFRPLLILSFALAAFVLHKLDPPDMRWSPYHRILIQPLTAASPAGPVTVGQELFVNRDIYQFMIDLSPRSHVPVDPYSIMWHAIYDLPFRMVDAKDVLIVGAGSGNDVAAALRAGVRHVDAVDIDPVILDAGRRLHPEHPYQDGRVTAHCQDGRQFFEDKSRRYDLVVMGFLDSQILLSQMSSVRLDSFIYTRESLAAARARLNDGGVFTLTFAAVEPWLASRLRGLAEEAFGPHVSVYKGWVDNLYLLAARKDGAPIPDMTVRGVVPVLDKRETLALTSDDWPFLYLRERGIPRDYLWVLAMLLVLSLLMLLLAVRGVPRAAPSLFFLGIGFLLLETLSISKLSLLFGATWIVSSVVITGFLLAILGANVLVMRRPPASLAWPYGVLFAAIGANAAVPVHAFLALPPAARIVAATLFFSIPVFCAGIVFATRFAAAPEVTMAFGLNTMGAMLGGVLEYMTMAFGFRALYAVVLLAYALSCLPARGPVTRPARRA